MGGVAMLRRDTPDPAGAPPAPRPRPPARIATRMARSHAMPDVTATVTVSEWIAVRPPLSVTVKVTVYCPASRYAWVTVRPLPFVPSPNVHAYDAIVPSGSYEADALNVTACSGWGVAGENTTDATGGWFVDGLGTADGLFDAPDQFGTSSDDMSANQ